MFSADLSTPGARRSAWLDSFFIDHAFFRIGWSNWAAVVPGRLYRSNHLTPRRLAKAAERYHLRTVINLRGERPTGSNALSVDAASKLGLTHIYMAFESRGAPHRDRILRIADIYRTMQEPALIHCKSGADRAGLAAGLFLLLNGGNSADALRQMSWRFGHVARSRTGILDAFFVKYAREGEGKKSFIDWVRDDYDEMALCRDFAAGGLASFLNDRILARE